MVRRHLLWSVCAALVAAACSDAVTPTVPQPLFSFSSNGITPSRPANGSLGEHGDSLAKGFDPKNPRLGDAVIATFFWVGSSSVDSVIDFVASTPNTRVGNTYHRVDSVSAGGYTMVTYVATNIQNFPDSSSTSGQILAVRAYLHQPVSDGGVKISSWGGVEDNFALALNDDASASGVDTSSTGIAAHTRPIAVNAGGLAYTATMGALDPNGGYTGLGDPSGFTSVGRGSDNQILEDGAFALEANAGTVDPTWTWVYGPPARPWLVTTFSLNAAPPPNRPPTVDAGPDETIVTGLLFTENATFSDPDNDGPWTYRIDWGDGSSTTGTATSQGTISAGHSYATILPQSFTLRVTVTDSHGASGSDTKIVSVAL